MLTYISFWVNIDTQNIYNAYFGLYIIIQRGLCLGPVATVEWEWRERCSHGPFINTSDRIVSGDFLWPSRSFHNNKQLSIQ